VRVAASGPSHGRRRAAAGEEGRNLRAGTVRIGLGLSAALAVAALAADTPGRGATSATAAAASPVALTASRFATDATDRPAKIVVANANGGGARILATAWFSFVSPDGSLVAVVDSEVNWYTNARVDLYASTGHAPDRTVDVNCIHVTWSPDSTKLACVELGTGHKPSRLLLIDAATGAKTALATGFFDSRLSFSPDSKQLAYVQLPTSTYFANPGKLRVVDLDTRATRTVRAGRLAAPAWGPTAIAFAVLKPRGSGRNTTYDVAVVQPDGSGFRQVTHFRPDAQLFGPSPVGWSADGKRLLAGMEGLDAWTQREAYAVDPIRGTVRLIAHQVSPAAVSRDGRYVIGQTGDAESTGVTRSNVVRVPWGGGAKKVLLRGAVEPSFNG
jgi:Tol biopolymer transport system component